MLNKLLLMLVLPVCLSAGIVRQNYNFTTPFINDNAVFLDGCHPFYQPFVPEVPVKSVRLLLPDGQKAVSYEVSYNDPVPLSGHYSVRPHRPSLRNGAKISADFFTRKASSYSMNRFFPGKVRDDGFEIQHKGGHPIFMTQLYPVQYNPVTGAMAYYKSITVTVQTAALGPDEQPVAYKSTLEVKSELSKMVDNPAGIAKLTTGIVTADDYEYLVITTNALRTSIGWDTLTAFNKRRGMRTKVVTIETIRSSMTGADEPEKMRNYIKQEYSTRSITYVLIAGDVEAPTAASPNRIMCRSLLGEYNDYGYRNRPGDNYIQDIPSDLYFGGLDEAPHDWHKVLFGAVPHWGSYGTEDKTTEVYVGRWCTDNATEITNILNKTIRYSEHPVDTLLTRALFAGEKLWGPGDPSDPHVETCYGDDLMEQLIGTCSLPSYAPYTTIGFPTTGWILSKLYGRVDVGWQDDEFAFIKRLKNVKPSIITHEGHSNAIYSFGTESFTTANFPQNCTPSAGNCFIVLSGGCYSGALDNNNLGTILAEDCVAEQLTTDISTGAVACILNSRYGIGNDGTNGISGSDGPETRLDRYFYHGLFTLGMHNIQKLNSYSKDVNAGDYTNTTFGWTNPVITGVKEGYSGYWGELKWTVLEKNLIGDPALSIWTAKPQDLKPSLPNPLTSPVFTVSVPKYSTVALADPATGNIIVSSTSGDGSSLTINNTVLTQYLQTHPAGQLRVIIKAHNYYPYSGTVNVSIASGTIAGLMDGRAFSAAVLRDGIKYSLGSAAKVTIELFDARGVKVRRVVTGMKNAGDHLVSFDDLGLRNGMYYCRLNAGTRSVTEKVIVTR